MHASRSFAGKSVQLALLLLLVGCGQTVQEDRSINYSTAGAEVAFQHGDEGVFVANGDGQQLERVYQSDAETIAISSPLWSPIDKRLIFTTARPAGRGPTSIAAWDSSPAGRQFSPDEVVYTCMLRPAPEDSTAAPPVPLFEAACDHPGYVAANLAVRWPPEGNRILFVDRTATGQHSIFEFDLATKARRQVLPRAAAALIFDWTPGGSYLVCVLASGSANSELDGIWIQPAGEQAWWHVPESHRLSAGRSLALLERLRMTRPVWTADERRFAFVVSEPMSAGHESAARHTIMTADPADGEVNTLYAGSAQIRDLHWEPRTGRLGFIEDAKSPVLRIVDESGAVLNTICEVRARRFAGWNHNASRLAYVAPEPARDSADWSALFPPVLDARDRVYVADGSGTFAGEVAHSGVRITFPQWSPCENSLSLWGTYTPTHRSLLAAWLPWSLHPGDPAAILDCDSGQLTWMAVNAHEQAQVGHYYLLRQEYEQAWQWYARAAAEREPPQAIKLSQLEQFLRGIRIHRDTTFFEYYCLTKLGRDAEAAARWEQFQTAMSFQLDIEQLEDLGEQWQGRESQLRTELGKLAAFATPLLRSGYITEVFLSLGATRDGIAFFARQQEAATTAPERLAAQLCLSQLLLLADDHQAYAELARTQLAPLLMEMIASPTLTPELDFTDLPKLRRSIEDFTLLAAGAAALAPLTSETFLDGLAAEELRKQLAGWQELGRCIENDAEQLAVDSVLAALLKQLGDDQYLEMKARIQANAFNDAFEFVKGR